VWVVHTRDTDNRQNEAIHFCIYRQFGTIETLLNLLFLLFSSDPIHCTLLNTLDCAGNHALSSHFTGAIVSKALEVSSALRGHLIWWARNETRCGIQSVSLSNTFETNFEILSTFPSPLAPVTSYLVAQARWRALSLPEWHEQLWISPVRPPRRVGPQWCNHQE